MQGIKPLEKDNVLPEKLIKIFKDPAIKLGNSKLPRSSQLNMISSSKTENQTIKVSGLVRNKMSESSNWS